MARDGRCDVSRRGEAVAEVERGAAAARRTLLLYGAGYCASSSLLLVTNKATLQAFPFPATMSVVQYAASALAVRVLASAGLVDAEPLRWARVRECWTITLVFCAAIFANMLTLQRTSVETVVVFRCAVPLATAVGDALFLGMALPSARSWAALLTIAAGSLVYVESAPMLDGGTLSVSCAYVLILAFEMVYVKGMMRAVQMSTFSRVLYNNSLSCAFGIALACLAGEPGRLARARTDELSVSALADTAGLLALSCCFGLTISFFGFGFRALVTSTTFTVVGLMCKVASVSASMLLLRSGAGARELLGLALCLAGGACYQQAAERPPAAAAAVTAGQIGGGGMRALEPPCVELGAAEGEPLLERARRGARRGTGAGAGTDADDDGPGDARADRERALEPASQKRRGSLTASLTGAAAAAPPVLPRERRQVVD
ncbi:hypothetical protein KFE25_009201 [Diacronema lutheri]|uniref:Sugar phosphate transporter domain-containing protein n=1 Tax=Diacronema lutheri TaxID=2081491 RepID=A0A8J6CHY8_DIALT|nr:hypothetical protein KFE25_009201 [Diacronema lutheri]